MTGPDRGPVPPPPPLPRVRVTAPQTSASRSAIGAIGPSTGTGSTPAIRQQPSEADRLYVRSLIRSQLRLAVVCALGFIVALAAIIIVSALPPLAGAAWAGVPLPWLLLGFGAYPVVLVIAVLYRRASRRNESGYSSLADDS
ncbi:MULTISPECIES: hypothetical protein [unclassified Leifsonia]|uniref:hypothetical protein n=1 Tax=unclassified Leifsonia TaxID=2663824 RepID=UPI0006FC110D|nr:MULTISPECIES: hypothetical protein [unclassified Leifsonia]KQX04946.1 hypothetical protein ASC59_11905 [Leifsonia sp. Root1293]KRA08578.1 hypothetical protein ASD61_11905 [Leifsonia sp. Root60]